MGLSFKHRIFRLVVGGVERVLRALSKDFYFKAVGCLFEALDLTYRIDTKNGPILLHCDSETVHIRARTLLEREPETLAWIETFAPGEVLWDIGANIGVFTLYAARVASAKVVAFDPLPFNHAGLVRNLTLNGLHDRVTALCIALSDKTEIAPLTVPSEADTPGGAGGVFAGATDNYGEAIDAVYELRALGYSIDDLLEKFDVPFPNYLKMDIDGIQERVIAGARGTLRDRRLKSAMLELQPAPQQTTLILKEMEDAGFELVETAKAVGGGSADIDTHVTNNFFTRKS